MSTPDSKAPLGDNAQPAATEPDIDALDLVEESVAVFGLDLRITAWNAGAERLYGWTREEVIGGDIQSFVKCSPSEPLTKILSDVREKGIWRGEFLRRTKNGGFISVSTKWSLRRDGSGAMLDIVETSRDVTELRRTEESLDRVQYQYQNLFQASVACFWELEFSDVRAMVRDLMASGVEDLRQYFLTHPDFVRQMIRATRIVDVNDQCVATFGNGDRSDLLEGLDPFWPDESLDVFAGSVVAAFEGSAHYSAEVAFRTLDGRRLETIFTVSYPRRLSSSARLLVGILDLTDAKRAKAESEATERRHQNFFHFLPVPLLRLDGSKAVEIVNRFKKQGIGDFRQHLKDHPDVLIDIMEGQQIVEVNQRAVEVLRGRSVEEFQGSIKRYWMESLDAYREVVFARYEGKRGYEALLKLVAHDGTLLDVLFFAAFAPVTGAENVSLVGLIDVTDRVKAQEMLAHVQAEMAHAARVSVLGELTASIAHEVNQPLTAIATNTEASLLWLGHSPPNLDEIRDLSNRTAAEVQRAADIINRIRSMALRASPQYKSVNVNHIVEEAMLFLRHELQRNEVVSSLRLGDDLPSLRGDPVQLQQVIVNLAVNAMQAMVQSERRPREILVTTSVAEDDYVRLDVADNGVGISENIFARLFESFFTTKANGMGIGLPICRSIIEAHGGEIRAANKAGNAGACFTVLLPSREPGAVLRSA
ncbi:MAG: ATP-binding protein [Methylovirgula sp.]|uniref:PAS domain-containing sensor histidine kinase n=1 Tax=Methylovirgula sp. TaxID=1978224 RepID=UPI0030760AF3